MPSERSPLTASKAKAMPSSGATIADERVTGRIAVLADEERREEDGRDLGGRLRGGPDGVGGEVDRDRRREPEHEQEHVEAGAQDVVSELLAGQTASRPARGGALALRGSVGARSRRPRGHSTWPRRTDAPATAA